MARQCSGRHDDRQHGDGKGQQVDRRHNVGDRKHEDSDRCHDDGKGQQGVRRHDDGSGRHNDGKG